MWRGQGAGAAQCVAGEARREARDWMSFAAAWARVGCAQLSTSCAEGLGETLTIFYHGLASKSSIRRWKALDLSFSTPCRWPSKSVAFTNGRSVKKGAVSGLTYESDESRLWNELLTYKSDESWLWNELLTYESGPQMWACLNLRK